MHRYSRLLIRLSNAVLVLKVLITLSGVAVEASVSLPICASVPPYVIGSTVLTQLQTSEVYYDSACSMSSISVASGTWLRINGTGNPVTVSTCDDKSLTYKTTIHIFTVCAGSNCTCLTCYGTSISSPAPGACASPFGASVQFSTVLGHVYLAGADGPPNPVVAVTTSGSAATGFSALYLENWIAAIVPAAPMVLLILIGLVAKTRPSSGRTRRKGYVPKGKEVQLTTPMISPDTYVAPVYTPSAAVITPGGPMVQQTPVVEVVMPFVGPEGPDDPVPWDACGDFESDCNQVIEYRCSGWIIGLNFFWAASICCFVGGLYLRSSVSYIGSPYPFYIYIAGGALLLVGVLSCGCITMCSWNNKIEDKTCGFCGARVLEESAGGFVSDEISHRACRPTMMFCSLHPGKILGHCLPLHGLLKLILHLLIGLVSVIGVLASLLLIAAAGSGGGGGNCNCNGCNDCGGSSSNKKAAVQQAAAVTSV